MPKVLVIGAKVKDLEEQMSGPQVVFNNIVKDIDTEKVLVIGNKDLRDGIKKIFHREIKTLHIFGFTRSNALLIIIGKILRKNIFYTANGLASRENLHFANSKQTYRIVEFITLKLADKIICVSEGLKEMVLMDYKIPKRKLKVIPNGVSKDILNRKPKYNYFEKILSVNSNKKVIFTACGTFKYKGIVQLVEVINNIQRNDFILVIAGPAGNVHEKVMNMIDSQKIIYVGNLNQEDLISAYYYSDFYIQNSVYETFGLAPLEALAMGTPAIVSKDVQMNYLLKNTEMENFVVNTNEELSQKINSLLDNPQVCEDLKPICVSIAQNSTWQVVRQQYKSLWEISNEA